MAKVETIKPRAVLAKKCQVCKRLPATKKIDFDYGFDLFLCEKDYSDLKQAVH